MSFHMKYVVEEEKTIGLPSNYAETMGNLCFLTFPLKVYSQSRAPAVETLATFHMQALSHQESPSWLSCGECAKSEP